MQLGHCKFDSDNGTLINLENGKVWHLPRAELQVLSLLIKSQGEVVEKAQLRAGDEIQPSLSDSSVTRAIFTLRTFLGPKYESLIETVKGQGYLLRHHRERKPDRVTINLNKKLPVTIFLIVTITALSILSYSLINHFVTKQTPSVTPLDIQTATLSSGQQVNVILYARSKTNNSLLLSLGEQVKESISQCKHSHWQNVYLSLSHDNQVLNMTMRGVLRGQSFIRNLKIADKSQPKQFISQQWLAEHNICSQG